MTDKNQTSERETAIRVWTGIIGVFCMLLFIVMLAFFSIFIIGTQRSRIVKDDLPINTLLTLKNTAAASDTEDSLQYILPEFIGVTIANESGSVGPVGNEELTKQLFSALSDYVKYVFSSAFTCERAYGTTGESLWRSACSEKYSVYVKLRGGLPDYVIRGFFDGGSETASGDMIMIKELFFIFNYRGDNKYNVRAVARSDSGETCAYNYNYKTAGISESFSLDHLTAFIKIGNLTGFDFYTNLSGGSSESDLSPSTLIYKSDIKLPSVIISETRESELDIDTVLTTLGYNIDKLNVYSEYNGDENYIESFGILRVSDKGELTFNATEDVGIPVSNYLYYGSMGGNYTTREKLSAVCSALNAIRKANIDYYGGQAYPVITSITEEDGLTIKFSYVVAGVNINEGGAKKEACVVKIKSNSITYIKLYPFNASLSEKKTVNYPQLWQLSTYGELNGGAATDIAPAYTISGIGEFDCVWTFKTEKPTVTPSEAADETPDTAGEEIP